MIQQAFQNHISVISDFIRQAPYIQEAADAIITSLSQGGCLYICGNGGSAADAQHIAAEFTGRYMHERQSLPAIALTTDTSAITAIGNDYSYDRIFSRQLEWLGKKGDVLLAISTSGNSSNILTAVKMAQNIWMFTIWLLGRDGGLIAKETNISIIVPSQITARIQEGHILAYHLICEIVDNHFANV